MSSTDAGARVEPKHLSGFIAVTEVNNRNSPPLLSNHPFSPLPGDPPQQPQHRHAPLHLALLKVAFVLERQKVGACKRVIRPASSTSGRKWRLPGSSSAGKMCAR